MMGVTILCLNKQQEKNGLSEINKLALALLKKWIVKAPTSLNNKPLFLPLFQQKINISFLPQFLRWHNAK